MDREATSSRLVLALRNAPFVLTHAGYSLLSDYTSGGFVHAPNIHQVHEVHQTYEVHQIHKK